jgi:putative oxidoreductase
MEIPMRLKQFRPPILDGRAAAGLPVLRLAVGAAFVLHGWPKVQNPNGWMTAEGMPAAPGFVQAFAAFGDLLGGFAIIAGALTPVACIVLLGVMGGAMATVHVPHRSPFIAPPGAPSCETVVIYSATLLLLLLAGPGAYSADARWFQRGVP